MKIKSYNEKIVYIFGGSSGIGLAIAKKIIAFGAHVIIFARDKERLENAVADIEKKRCKSTQLISYKSVDISLHQDVERVISTAAKEYGNPDILINCAGRACPGYFESITYEQFEETMKINLFGIWSTIQASLPYMKDKGGVIVNTSSVAGFLGIFGYTDYAASKFGVIGLSDALRHELLQYNISVSVLCPPDTNTPGFELENKTKPIETVAISEGGGLMSSEQVADRLIKGLSKGEIMIIPGLSSKTTYFLKRWFPTLLEFIIKRMIRKTQRQKS